MEVGGGLVAGGSGELRGRDRGPRRIAPPGMPHAVSQAGRGRGATKGRTLGLDRKTEGVFFYHNGLMARLGYAGPYPCNP